MFKIQHHCTGKEYFSYEELVLDRINKEDMDSYIEPNHTYDIHYTKYHNMVKGIELLDQHLQNDSVIGILVDVDVDGYTSAAMLKMFIKDIKPKSDIRIIHHDTKMHGLYDGSMAKILDEDIECLILPDSSSNDIDEILTLTKYMDVIVIDHHDISDERFYSPDINVLGGVALINNQSRLNKESNKHLTGAGMTLRFIEGYFDHILGLSNGYNYYDLAAMGLIGDMADYSDYEIRNIVFKGLEYLNNQLARTALKSKIPHITNYIPMDIAFNFNPFINATTRVADMEEKEMIFDTLSNNDNTSTVTVERRRKIKGQFKKVDVTFSAYEYVFDLMEKIKGRQDRLVKKLEQELYDDINNDGGVAVGLICEDYKGITGLVANRVSSNLQKPTLLFRDKEGEHILSGSARGNTKILNDFKSWCQGTELFELAEGHDNAFGIEIKEHKIHQLIDESKEISKQEKIYNVDLSFQTGEVDANDIAELNDLSYLTGGEVDNIKIGLHKYKVYKSDIQTFKTVSKIKLNKNTEIILFNDNGGIWDVVEFGDKDYAYIDLVGRPNINIWLGKKTYQIIADDIQMSSAETLINETPVINTMLF